jgi:heme exporter protein B
VSAKASFIKQYVTLVGKDLRLETRSRSRLNATLFFALLTLLLFSFASGPAQGLLSANAAGYLWLALLLSSVLLLGESLRLETDNDNLEALRLLPVSPRALFLAKATTNALFLFVLGAILVPVSIALYGIEVKMGVPRLIGIIALGALGIAAPGTLHATIAGQARAKDVLLPLLLFPVLVPSLLAAVRATALVTQGDPMDQLGDWLKLLAIFDGLYWFLCTLMYGFVIEE